MNNMKELCIYVPIELEILQCEKYSKLYAIIICYSCPHVKQIYLSTKTVHIILRNKLAVLPKISSSDSVKYWHIIKFKNCIVLKLHSRLWYFLTSYQLLLWFFWWLTDPQQAASTIAMQKASVRDVLIRMSPCTSTWISTKALSLINAHTWINAFQPQT